jgi:hypothetical protein
MAATFEEMVLQERQRLESQITDIEIRQRELQEELALVKRELAALDAYEAAKSGKPRRSASSRSSRVRRRDAILAAVKQHANGISRGDLLEAMGLRGNKSGEQSVSNALNNLKKAGSIVSSDGKYAVA